MIVFAITDMNLPVRPRKQQIQTLWREKYLWYLKSIPHVLTGMCRIAFAMCYCKRAGVKALFSHCFLEYGAVTDLSFLS